MLNQTDQTNMPPHESNAQPLGADTHICEDYVDAHPSVPTAVWPECHYIFGHDLQFHASPQNGQVSLGQTAVKRQVSLGQAAVKGQASLGQAAVKTG
jgi:hypothetical protein